MAVNIRPTLVIESDGTVINDALTATRPFTVYDYHGVVTNQAASTTTLQSNLASAGLVSISDALTDNAAAGTLARAALIVAAQATLATGDALQNTSSGLGRQATYTAIIPRPIPGT